MVYNSFEQTSGVATPNPDLSNVLSDVWAVDIRNAPPPESQPPERPLPEAPSMEQMAAMRAAAEQGRLIDTANTVFLRALATNGLDGLLEARNELNRHLTAQDSEYQARIARVLSNGNINFIIMLQRDGENLNDMAADIMRNGGDSQYAQRAIRFELTPQRPPDA